MAGFPKNKSEIQLYYMGFAVMTWLSNVLRQGQDRKGKPEVSPSGGPGGRGQGPQNGSRIEAHRQQPAQPG